MGKKYNYKNCQSLFGYSYNVHLRSRGVCQLCFAGALEPSFDLWRQLTVEHLIGKANGGYLKDIKIYVAELLPELSDSQQKELIAELDAANTVSACSFCNSTTSRYASKMFMKDLISESLLKSRCPSDIVSHVTSETQKILNIKRADVAWKLKAIREQYENQFIAKVNNKAVYRKFEGGAVFTSESCGKFQVIINENSVSDLLEDEDIELKPATNILEFISESSRADYLLYKYGPPEY